MAMLVDVNSLSSASQPITDPGCIILIIQILFCYHTIYCNVISVEWSLHTVFTIHLFIGICIISMSQLHFYL